MFSPAQVTEHHHVELKDQFTSQDTRDRFDMLKRKCPRVFSLNSQDIRCPSLVTMHVDMEDNRPFCQMPYTLPLKHYHWIQQEIKTLECVGVIKKSISPWASLIIRVPNKLAVCEPPRQGMWIDFRRVNELQP